MSADESKQVPSKKGTNVEAKANLEIKSCVILLHVMKNLMVANQRNVT